MKYDLNVDKMDGLERDCCMVEFWYNLQHNGLEWKWSWKKLLCTKLLVTLAIMVGFGCNFDTIWAPIRVTSGVNCNCLPSLLWKLLCVLCVFLTLCQICSCRCTRGTIGTTEFENLNFNGWTLFWLDLNQIEAKMLNLWWFRQWSWKESKWSWKNHICPYFDHIACIFNKSRSNGLERNHDPLLFTV